jgi:hypothetical protein
MGGTSNSSVALRKAVQDRDNRKFRSATVGSSGALSREVQVKENPMTKDRKHMILKS